MVEVPSAALLSEAVARQVDFFSLGTNDLTQYTLAVDRTNPQLAAWQDPLHPAVLRLIGLVVEAAAKRGIPVAACGEMAGDPAGAVVLAGLGVGELSMGVGSFGAVKEALASVERARLESLAAECLAAPSARQSRTAANALLADERAA